MKPSFVKMSPSDARWDLKEALYLHWTGHRDGAMTLIVNLCKCLDEFHNPVDDPLIGANNDPTNYHYYSRFWS